MTHEILRKSPSPTPAPLGVEIEILHHEAKIPVQAKHSDAGYDLTSVGDGWINPQSRVLISTGIAVAIPEGYVGYIKPRSGIADRQGIDVLGGVIDSGYRGEVKVILLNTSTKNSFQIRTGDRIAQLVIQPVEKVGFVRVEKLAESERGHGGFGSTGIGNPTP